MVMVTHNPWSVLILNWIRGQFWVPTHGNTVGIEDLEKFL